MAELQLSKTRDVWTRVEDYLNDKIQTAADLDQVDSLLLRVQEQQDLLRKQVGFSLQYRRQYSYDSIARRRPKNPSGSAEIGRRAIA